MDWVTGIQRAIDYVEDNITESIDYDEVAKRAYSSNYHFQRVFSVLCGYPLGEYIRSRRLTLAGSELAGSDIKVIDAALKYGYDSPDSFTKAFTRFHGITPSAAKQRGASLKSFSRLSIKLSLEGGNIMNYRIEEKEAMKIAARTKRFTTDEEINRRLIPEFWNTCAEDGTFDVLCGMTSEESVFGRALLGICSEDTCRESSDFEYSIGTQYMGGPVPDGYTIKDVPKLTWAVFECRGAVPQGIQEGWHKVYAEFFPASEYEQYSQFTFEVYPDGDRTSSTYVSEIWIPVRKK
ncbi:AraC family transcriptional regulator [Clostridium sp. AM58-1XD]|uniref:AraC family transcriptional regulator n=1 Tax=Clostridium sp. AM58-1XD TaxID=2292307 RepID=UPI000E5387BD|nr:AraC family transcriptional regulator [Clostridium sp. AM58-1XD]RGY95709.1 AraC family transcriptional regulator [Clostridium sp. AM58-1XD]